MIVPNDLADIELRRQAVLVLLKALRQPLLDGTADEELLQAIRLLMDRYEIVLE